jgi:hypothetical protein
MIAVQNGGTNLQEEMCAAPRPPHLLLLDHASGNELIDSVFSQGCENALPGTVTNTAVDNGAHVEPDIGHRICNKLCSRSARASPSCRIRSTSVLRIQADRAHWLVATYAACSAADDDTIAVAIVHDLERISGRRMMETEFMREALGLAADIHDEAQGQGRIGPDLTAQVE